MMDMFRNIWKERLGEERRKTAALSSRCREKQAIIDSLSDYIASLEQQTDTAKQNSDLCRIKTAEAEAEARKWKKAAHDIDERRLKALCALDTAKSERDHYKLLYHAMCVKCGVESEDSDG